MEGLFGPTSGFSRTCSLMNTVCHNFRYSILKDFYFVVAPDVSIASGISQYAGAFTVWSAGEALPLMLKDVLWTDSTLIFTALSVSAVEVCETNYDTGLLLEAGTAFLAATLSRLLHHMLLERYVRTRLSRLSLFGFSPCLLSSHLFLEVHSASIWVNVLESTECHFHLILI